MATLQELMAEVLGETSQGQEKTAAAKPTSSEVDQVLENLGLQGYDTVKTASINESGKNGGNMSLADIYDQIMGEGAPVEQEKTASEGTTEEVTDDTTAFGELVGNYFNEALAPYFEKISYDLEAAAGKGELPMAHLTTGGSMTAALGKAQDPYLEMNHSASGGAPLRVMTNNSSPYSLKESALAKAISKRAPAVQGGKITE